MEALADEEIDRALVITAHPDTEKIRQLMRDKLTATAVEYSLGEGRLGEKFAVYRLP